MTRTGVLPLALALSAAVIPSSLVAAEKSPGAVVAKVDHVLVEARDAVGVFALLTNELQLPVVWPFADYGGFSSGGVSLGNAVMEIGRFGYEPDAPGPHLYGIAFEPRDSAAASVAELDRRHIEHGRPEPFRGGRQGEERLLWTNVYVTDVPPAEASLFICDYAIDARTPRAAASAKLEGNPMGVVGVKEIVIGVRDPDDGRRKWRALLDGSAVEREPGVFAFAAGPAITVVKSASDGLQSITLRVASRTRAESFLAGHGVLQKGKGGETLLAGPKLQGLEIVLVER